MNEALFSKLPKEIINYIIKYDGKLLYKDGKYTNRIPSYDERFKILAPVPQKMKIYVDYNMPTTDIGFSIHIKFTNDDFLLTVQKYAYGNYIYYTFINKKNITINQYKTLL
jgi:hypothetical protein